jgi:hypothetical protein
MRHAGSKRVDALLSAVGVVAAVAAVAILPGRLMSTGGWLVSADSRRPSAGAVEPAKAYLCARMDGDGDYCGRVVRDRVRREELTALDRNQASGPASRIATAVAQATASATSQTCVPAKPPPDPPPCMLVRNAAVGLLLQAIRRELSAAGFAHSVVRRPGADDPAPDNSIVYGIRIELYASEADQACLVGFTRADGSGGWPEVVGTLPDGSCLSG